MECAVEFVRCLFRFARHRERRGGAQHPQSRRSRRPRRLHEADKRVSQRMPTNVGQFCNLSKQIKDSLYVGPE